jgi:hypothetical protein
MRSLLSTSALAAIFALAPAGAALALEVPAAVTAAIPAANASYIAGATALVDKVMGQAQSSLDIAKQATALPFAGDAAKAKVKSAEAQIETAKELKSELTSLSHGQKPAADSILGKLAAGATAGASAGPSLADRFKGLPLASTLQTVLGNPDITGALVQMLPLDKVPGYATAQQALAAFSPAAAPAAPAAPATPAVAVPATPALPSVPGLK